MGLLMIVESQFTHLFLYNVLKDNSHNETGTLQSIPNIFISCLGNSIIACFSRVTTEFIITSSFIFFLLVL